MIGLGKTGQSVFNLLTKIGCQVEFCEPFNDTDWAEVYTQVKEQEYEVIVLSPGINNHPVLQKLKKENSPRVATDIELFCELVSVPIIAITGTNGKTTCVHWLYQLLSQYGRVKLLGNVGRPVLDAYFEMDECDWVILELSSFQLAHSAPLPLHIGCVLNIQNDHLDWHDNFDDYSQSKWRIGECAKTKICHAELAPPDEWQVFGSTTDMQLYQKPDHLSDMQYNNALAVYAITRQLDVPSTFSDVIELMPQLKHRAESIGQEGQWHWINDSKATNFSAARACLNDTRKRHPHAHIIWLAGGVLKEQLPNDTQRLADEVWGFGQDGPIISPLNFQSLEECLSYAYHQWREYDDRSTVVCLSPAGASFDEFKNYQERGAFFTSWFHEVMNVSKNSH